MTSLPPKGSLVPSIVGALVALAVVTAAGLLIVADPAWSAGEVRIVAAVNGVHGGFLDGVARTVNVVFGPSGAILLTLLLLAWTLLLSRSWLLALRVGVTVAVPWACADALKYVVRRPRPAVADIGHVVVAHPTSFSYPSGHTAFAAALCCAVALAMAAGRGRAIAIAAAAVVVLVVAWSRVYLGVHYPTDVLAAIILVPFASVAVHRIAGRMRLFADLPALSRARIAIVPERPIERRRG